MEEDQKKSPPIAAEDIPGAEGAGVTTSTHKTKKKKKKKKKHRLKEHESSTTQPFTANESTTTNPARTAMSEKLTVVATRQQTSPPAMTHGTRNEWQTKRAMLGQQDATTAHAQRAGRQPDDTTRNSRQGTTWHDKMALFGGDGPGARRLGRRAVPADGGARVGLHE